MDRFIGADGETEYYLASSLKSNMDRFIVDVNYLNRCLFLNFKIQYGQIYRTSTHNSKFSKKNFKIQYGQIYSIGVTTTQQMLEPLKSNMDRFIGN